MNYNIITIDSSTKEDKSSIPQCITSNYIINARTLKYHFDMDALE